MKTSTKSILKVIIFAVTLYFVTAKFMENWSKVAVFDWDIDILALALSIALHLLTFLMFSKVWCWLIGAYGHKVHLQSAFKIGYLANLGRYIPGKIWPVFGMAYLAEQVGVSRRESVSSWIVALLYANLASLVAALGFVLLDSSLASWISSIISETVLAICAVFGVLASAVLILTPKYVSSVVNYFLKLLRKERVTLIISRQIAAKVFLGYAACWIMYGMAFWSFTHAFNGHAPLNISAGIGSYIVAYQLGYLAFFSPGGIGVRELVLVVFLQQYIGDASYPISLAARLWNMVVEALAATIALGLRFK